MTLSVRSAFGALASKRFMARALLAAAFWAAFGASAEAQRRFEIGAGAASLLPQGGSQYDVPNDFFGCALFAVYPFAETPFAAGLQAALLAPVAERPGAASQLIPTNYPDLRPQLWIGENFSFFQHVFFRVQNEPTRFQFYADVLAGALSLGNVYQFSRNGEPYKLPSSASVARRVTAFSYGAGMGARALMPGTAGNAAERRYLLEFRAVWLASAPGEFLERSTLNYDKQTPEYSTKKVSAQFLLLQLSAVFPL